MNRPTIATLCAFMAMGIANAQVQDPPPVQEKDIFDTIAITESLKTFSQVIELADVKTVLKSKGTLDAGYTVFAPTEAAFQRLPKPILEKLMEDKSLLKEVIQFHVLSGKSASVDLLPDKKLKTLQNEELTIKVEDGTTWVNAAKVLSTDTRATNGIIHQIDTVLIPPTVAKKLGIGGT